MGCSGITCRVGSLIERATRERLLRKEQEMLRDFLGSGYVEEKGAVTAMDEMRERPTADMIMDAVRNLTPMEAPLGGVETEVLIVNATTAAALRKQLSPETLAHIEMIITDAADTGTVYQVTNDDLRKSLLRSIAEGRREVQ